ncbi:NAD(P)H-quinone oxidoreductase [Shouchella patagoniensis]|uniref:NAD(P)H-quinone oxidoreductase n=1 Tax=Shouchella patagoniensis TaxID=228576 RepID=UPI000994C133|nr:NAD(P)H-quinone oxidoreductase [Shouchella patagoniensis]
MKAITVKQPGDAKQLQISDQDKPKTKDSELLVRVKAAAVNRTDLLMREGKAGYETNPILGVEVAGVVEQSPDERNFVIGDRVMGLVNGGGYAEYAVMPAERAMKVPVALSFAEGAAIPEVFLTAYQTLFWHGKLQEQETVLIHAGASGVGTAAIQLAKQLKNATVIVTAGSQDKLDFCQSLGADVLINYKEEDFSEKVKEATNGKGVDVILDFIGADYWEKNLASIATEGRWVLIGILGGAEVETLNLFALMSKCVQLTGTLLTPRSDTYKAELTNEFAHVALPLFEKKTLQPVVDKIFPIEESTIAHEHMEANKNIGKIVLSV